MYPESSTSVTHQGLLSPSIVVQMSCCLFEYKKGKIQFPQLPLEGDDDDGLGLGDGDGDGVEGYEDVDGDGEFVEPEDCLGGQVFKSGIC